MKACDDNSESNETGDSQSPVSVVLVGEAVRYDASALVLPHFHQPRLVVYDFPRAVQHTLGTRFVNSIDRRILYLAGDVILRLLLRYAVEVLNDEHLKGKKFDGRTKIWKRSFLLSYHKYRINRVF